MPKVVIAGGGVGGLTAAHELAKRSGFDVHVYEKASFVGGKAASQDFPVGAAPGKDLGEHGFRFFPWFYRHLAETLAEIPGVEVARVFDALEESTHTGMARGGAVHAIRRGKLGPLDFLQIVQLFLGPFGCSPTDMARFAGYLLKFYTSCPRRRAAVYEFMSWSQYAGIMANEYDPQFEKLIEAVPNMLVAMRSSTASARTLGNVGLQMLYDFDEASYDKVDAVLHGPTSRIWLEPWRAHLANLGVTFHTQHELVAIELAPPGAGAMRRVQQLVFRHGGTQVTVDVSSGYCVCALPIEAMDPILTPALVSADPDLQALQALIHDPNGPPWSDMIGAQYLLGADVPMLRGHVAYPESDWALTSVSQAQFWRSAQSPVNPDLAAGFGVPGVDGVLSVIASDWHTAVQDPASPVEGRSADACTRAEVLAEIWRQLVAAAFPNAAAAPAPTAAQLDRNVKCADEGGFHNPTPLLVHPPGSYPRRPPAKLSRIDNLVLAADYVRTHTELATMEGANEAGRWAVRAILQRASSPQPWPDVHPLDEGGFGSVAQALDCALFDLGAGNPLDLVIGSEVVGAPPDGFWTFDTRAFEQIPLDDVDAWSAAPRVDAARFLEAFRGQPMFAIPSVGLVYRPFPRPDELPAHLDDRVRELYRRFFDRRDVLARFRERPTEEGFRMWEELLMTGKREAAERE